MNDIQHDPYIEPASEIKPTSQDAGEDAALRNTPVPAGEGGLTTTFAGDGTQTLTKDGPQSPHIQSQDEFWDGVQTADQTPHEVQSTVAAPAPPDPDTFPGEVSNRGDNTGDTDSSVLI